MLLIGLPETVKEHQILSIIPKVSNQGAVTSVEILNQHLRIIQNNLKGKFCCYSL